MWYIMVNQFLPFWFLLKKNVNKQTHLCDKIWASSHSYVKMKKWWLFWNIYWRLWKVNKSLWFIYRSVHERTMSFVPRGWHEIKTNLAVSVLMSVKRKLCLCCCDIKSRQGEQEHEEMLPGRSGVLFIKALWLITQETQLKIK